MATRRQFLEAMGRVGGVSAVYLSMQALGLLAMPRAFAGTPNLGRGTGQGKSVVILGAGIAGLVAAYELRKAGYAVTVLEANDRIGGRVWTVRGGDRILQTGRPDQRSDHDDGLYFNAGAARIPAHHHAILGYARDLKVPLEVMVNVNRSAGMDFGSVVRERQAVNDVRGRFAELLAKAIDKGALDGELTGVDKQALRGYLGWWGDLKHSGAFKGSERSGYTIPPGGYGDAGKLVDPLTLRQLADHGFFQSGLVFEEIFDQQAPMFQPVGGMDRIAMALFEQVKQAVRLSTPVTGVRPTADGGARDAQERRRGRRRLLPVHFARAPRNDARRALLRGQALGAEGDALLDRVQGRVAGAALLGARGASMAASPGQPGRAKSCGIPAATGTAARACWSGPMRSAGSTTATRPFANIAR